MHTLHWIDFAASFDSVVVVVVEEREREREKERKRAEIYKTYISFVVWEDIKRQRQRRRVCPRVRFYPRKRSSFHVTPSIVLV